MELSEAGQREFVRRLLLSRMRLLSTHGFYGLLLMHMRFALSEDIETAATNGEFIYFSPDFLQALSDRELDFVMMHEVLHVALQHCLRGKELEGERFNVACDIVVNSTILQENHMDLQTITLRKYGESMHLAPDGKEGYEYTAEQVYEMLGQPQKLTKLPQESGRGSRIRLPVQPNRESYRDDHSLWGSGTMQEEAQELWSSRVIQAARAIEIRDPSDSRGLLPRFAKRLLRELTCPQNDWRTILNEFVQLEINDYSFSPPDRRYSEGPFFLPDYNAWGEGDQVHNILFMVDTSGSVSNAMLSAAFSEIKGAVDQFDGKLKGWLGFFDAAVIPPEPFEDVAQLLKIHPYGGGGTSFRIIFDYVQSHMQDPPPACIIILTDGYAPFPKERHAQGIPVLWLLNNETVDPPWGKVARIQV